MSLFARARLFASAVSVAAALCGCGFLVSGGPLDDAGLTSTTSRDGGEAPYDGGSRDGGPVIDAGTRDAGPADAGATDAGLPVDAGGALDAGSPPLDAGDAPDAASEDAGGDESDAGVFTDAGSEPDDAGDAGAPRFVVLGSGSATGSASVSLVDATLGELTSVVIFIAREEVAVVDLPGDWSSATFRSAGSGAERIVGTTREYQAPPTTLENPLTIGVESGERFSYALIGVVGLGAPSNDDATEGDAVSTSECNALYATSHALSRSYPFYALTGLTHRRAPAKPAAGGREIAKEEPALGPSLLVQEVTSDLGNTASSESCVSAAGRFVSVAQFFEQP